MAVNEAIARKRELLNGPVMQGNLVSICDQHQLGQSISDRAAVEHPGLR